MASNRVKSSGPDFEDLVTNLVAFEALNSCRLEIRMSTGDRKGRADLLVTVLAHGRMFEIGEVAPLASASVSCLATNLRSLDAVLIRVLYALDSQLEVHYWRDAIGDAPSGQPQQ